MCMDDHGFPRSRRLLNKAAFDRVFNGPSVRLRKGPLLLLATPSVTSDARLGMVVGKRNAARAVSRNRIRRQIRETFRRNARLPAYDIVVMARSGIAELDRRQLRSVLNSLWARLQIQAEDHQRPVPEPGAAS